MNAGRVRWRIMSGIKGGNGPDSGGEVKTLPQKNWNWATGPAASRKTVILCWRQCFSCSRETQMTSVRSWMLWHQNAVKAAIGIPESAGSTFKRPEGHFAGRLIQDAGASRLPCGRRPGVREALRLCDQPGSCHLCRYPFSVQTGTGKGESAVWCGAGTGSKASG